MIPQLYTYFKIVLVLSFVDVLILLRLKRLPFWKRNQRIAYTAWWCSSILQYLCIFLSLFFIWNNFIVACLQFIPITLLLGKLVVLLFVALDQIVLRSRDIGKRLRNKEHPTQEKDRQMALKRSDFIVKSGILLSSIPMAALSRGFLSNLYDYQIKHVNLILPDLPTSFEGIRIAQISDIHAGSLYNQHAVKRGVDMLLEQNPDLIFFTGDLVNDFGSEMDDYLAVFDKVRAPLGTFSILGNHDYGDYHFNRFHFGGEQKLTKEQNLANIKDIHRQLGWRLLLNESEEIIINNDKITVVGVENWGANNLLNYGNLDRAMAKVDLSSPINLLLSHDPSHWRAEIIPKYPTIDVTFSGHTHGGQFGYINPHYQWSPIEYAYSEWAGLYYENQQALYVNAGFGYLDYPSRVGILPEITIFHLLRQAD